MPAHIKRRYIKVNSLAIIFNLVMLEDLYRVVVGRGDCVFNVRQRASAMVYMYKENE